MRVNQVRFSTRIALAAVLALALGGCATRNGLSTTPPPETIAADAQKTADTANAGAQTKTATRLQKFLWVFSPYRPDIQQGNFVSQEMLAQLKVGKTREEVRFIFGTPLLSDIFHAERWDYPFYLARGDGELTSSRVSIYFKDDKVVKFDGGNLPTEKEYIARIAGPARIAPKEMPKKEEVGSATIQINK